MNKLLFLNKLKILLILFKVLSIPIELKNDYILVLKTSYNFLS